MPKDFPIRIAEDNSAAIAQAEAGLAQCQALRCSIAISSAARSR